MALSNWLNGDKFSALRDKYNAIVSVLNGQGRSDLSGTANAVNYLLPQIGDYKLAAYTDAPNDSWMLCNGEAISRTDYAELFAKIGESYGVGNGTTTFNLPNWKGRFPAGYDPGDSDYNALTSAKSGGTKMNTLTVGQLPPHNHPFVDNTIGTGGPNNYATGGAATNQDNNKSTGDTGSGDPIENRPPYLPVNWLIRVK